MMSQFFKTPYLVWKKGEGEDETDGGKNDAEKAIVEVESEGKQNGARTQGAGNGRVEIPKKGRCAPVGTEGKGTVGKRSVV